MALTDEQKRLIREEEIERLRVRRELSGEAWKAGDARKTIIFWVVLIAVAALLWSVVTSPHNH